MNNYNFHYSYIFFVSSIFLCAVTVTAHMLPIEKAEISFANMLENSFISRPYTLLLNLAFYTDFTHLTISHTSTAPCHHMTK